jgi:hypothetical protein
MRTTEAFHNVTISYGNSKPKLRIQFSLKNLEVSQLSNTFLSQHEFQNKALRIPPCNPQQDKIQSVCASGKTSDRERGEEDSLHSSIPLLLA